MKLSLDIEFDKINILGLAQCKIHDLAEWQTFKKSMYINFGVCPFHYTSCLYVTCHFIDKERAILGLPSQSAHL